VLPPGTPKDRVEILQVIQRSRVPRRVSKARQRRSLSVDPEELAKIIREMPRDPEVVEMLKKFSGVDPLPSR
jgi:hypothetical protein